MYLSPYLPTILQLVNSQVLKNKQKFKKDFKNLGWKGRETVESKLVRNAHINNVLLRTSFQNAYISLSLCCVFHILHISTLSTAGIFNLNKAESLPASLCYLSTFHWNPISLHYLCPGQGWMAVKFPVELKKKKEKPFLPEAASFNSQSTWLIYICEGHGTSVKEVKNGTAHVRGCLQHLGMTPNK